MRVWIEMQTATKNGLQGQVTLRVRVWIEIADTTLEEVLGDVTLRVRVWIEIRPLSAPLATLERHPPCEGVD